MLKAEARKIFDSFDINKDRDYYEKSLKTMKNRKPSYRESASHKIPPHPIDKDRRGNVTVEITMEAGQIAEAIVLVNAPRTVQVLNHE